MGDFRSFKTATRRPAMPMQPLADPAGWSPARHLLRLWLYDPNGRVISAEQRAGRFGRGVQIKGVARVAPLDVDAAA